MLWPWVSKILLGRLPGEIVMNNPNYKIYFPITRMIIVSLIVSMIIWLIRK
ncbi:MAG: DUF2905 domain-containing protein [Deltaproteobacteria bacterium]|nr:DUF2905 domain-containing protein [Deltaproteobacteria bacterium]MBW1848662.1 DUF2905 domain-containing protein [Deltaproteobacteria bacterium]